MGKHWSASDVLEFCDLQGLLSSLGWRQGRKEGAALGAGVLCLGVEGQEFGRWAVSPPPALPFPVEGRVLALLPAFFLLSPDSEHHPLSPWKKAHRVYFQEYLNFSRASQGQNVLKKCSNTGGI